MHFCSQTIFFSLNNIYISSTSRSKLFDLAFIYKLSIITKLCLNSRSVGSAAVFAEFKKQKFLQIPEFTPIFILKSPILIAEFLKTNNNKTQLDELNYRNVIIYMKAQSCSFIMELHPEQKFRLYLGHIIYNELVVKK